MSENVDAALTVTAVIIGSGWAVLALSLGVSYLGGRWRR